MYSKLVLMLVVAAFATSPAVAATKQKTVKQTTEAEDSQTARQYPARPKGRAPARTAELVIACI
jgi:hypothetical protein